MTAEQYGAPEAGNPHIRSIPGTDVLNVATKRVCKICNEGWMEQRLERPCRPLLPPMILGQTVTLDPAAQALVAGWAAKVAMVARYVHLPPDPVEPEWLDHVFRHHRPPATWYIWTTGYNGRRRFFYSGRDITIGDPPDSLGAGTPHGVLMSLVIGYAAFTVMGIKSGTPDFPGVDHAFRLWPPTDLAVTWPPEYHLDDAALPGFAHMFLDEPGEPVPPLP